MIIKPHLLWLQLTKTMVYFLEFIICSPLLFLELILWFHWPNLHQPQPQHLPLPPQQNINRRLNEWEGEREREMGARSRNVEYTEQTKSYAAAVALSSAGSGVWGLWRSVMFYSTFLMVLGDSSIGLLNRIKQQASSWSTLQSREVQVYV